MKTALIYVRAYAGFGMQFLGGLLLGVVMAQIITPAASGSSEAGVARHDAAKCTDCPATVQPDSVELTQRGDAVLFVVRGTWPTSVDALPASIHLTANGDDIVLRPHGSLGAFEVPVALRDGKPMADGDVAAGIEKGALLITVKGLAVPVTFTLGLTDGLVTSGALPRKGALRWSGSSLETVAATPPKPPALHDGTDLARACGPSLPAGSIERGLTIKNVAAASARDPRLGGVKPTITITTAENLITVPPRQPYVVVVAIAPFGTAPRAGVPAIDGAGTTQLVLFRDGASFVKAIRTRDASGTWTSVEAPDSAGLSVVFDNATATFYFPGLDPSTATIGAIVATKDGCAYAPLPG